MSKRKIKIGLSEQDKLNMKNEIYDKVSSEVDKGLKVSGTDTANNILAFTENKGIYVATDTGGWYYWKADVSKYVYGGTYQATEIADNSVTPEKTTFIDSNVIYENELLTFNYNGTWKGNTIRIDNVKPSTDYTLFVESVSGTLENIYVVYLQEYDSENNKIKDNNTKETLNLFKTITTLENTSYIKLAFYGSNGTAGSGTAVFKGIQFVEGTQLSNALNENILISVKQVKELDKKIDEINNDIEELKNDTNLNETYTENLSNEIVLSGKYVSNVDGKIYDNSQAYYTDYINVSTKDTFYISGAYRASTCMVATYDKDKNFIRKYGYGASTKTIWTDEEFTPQDDEKYVRFGSFEAPLIVKKLMYYTIVKKFEEVNKLITETNGNVLYAKKYVACGDSFTEGDFTGFVDENGLSGKNSPYLYDSNLQMYKTYPYWIAKRNNMALVNEAKCGSDFTNIEGANNPFSLTRYLNVPKDANYITLMFGLNEYNLTTEQIGTKNDTTNATLWGAYNIVFEYFLTNMPYAKIGVIISDAWMNKTYSNALKEICVYWGIPYLDLKDDINVPMGIGGRLRETSSKARELRNNAFRVSNDNNHPNLEAHKYRSTFIENFLRSL